jgi:diguanylate cyclase (GGDEF)-like protein
MPDKRDAEERRHDFGEIHRRFEVERAAEQASRCEQCGIHKLFRFGGEEFVVLLKPAELASARAAFERCRREVEQYSFPQVGRVTVSAGFTRIGIYDTPSVILDNADEALYYAKGNGRNRVCCYEELIAAGQLVKHHVLNTDAVMF